MPFCFDSDAWNVTDKSQTRRKYNNAWTNHLIKYRRKDIEMWRKANKRGYNLKCREVKITWKINNRQSEFIIAFNVRHAIEVAHVAQLWFSCRERIAGYFDLKRRLLEINKLAHNSTSREQQQAYAFAYIRLIAFINAQKKSKMSLRVDEWERPRSKKIRLSVLLVVSFPVIPNYQNYPKGIIMMAAFEMKQKHCDIPHTDRDHIRLIPCFVQPYCTISADILTSESRKRNVWFSHSNCSNCTP